MAIKNSARYARTKGIESLDPTTWDDEYKNRQLELAGIKSAVKLIEKGLNKMNKRFKGRKGS